MFAASFVVGFWIMTKIFRNENRPEKDLNDLIWFMIIGTVAGARLGHCLFYNPAYYLSNPLEILMIQKGGLASHGAAIGILLAIYIYIRKNNKYSFIWLMDRIVITVALGGAFIRLGNLFNSEIIGMPTNGDWGFIFLVIDNIPRHPAQLYESLAYLLVFITLVFIYRSNWKTMKEGLLFGVFLIAVFGFRFIIEFVKEDQTYFEEGWVLNMGQLLSLPLILYGFYLLLFYKNKSSKK